MTLHHQAAARVAGARFDDCQGLGARVSQRLGRTVSDRETGVKALNLQASHHSNRLRPHKVKHRKGSIEVDHPIGPRADQSSELASGSRLDALGLDPVALRHADRELKAAAGAFQNDWLVDENGRTNEAIARLYSGRSICCDARLKSFQQRHIQIILGLEGMLNNDAPAEDHPGLTAGMVGIRQMIS